MKKKFEYNKIKDNTYKEKPFAKKSLGQNFLKSQGALNTIIKAGELTSKDTVLEIGPGRGALTEKLLQTGARVVAVEKDSDLKIFLEEKFSLEIKNNKLLLIEGDILKITNKKAKLPEKYKLIANIPYYITGEILRTFLEERTQPEKMVLLVQKEVAQRITAQDKKESILSISVKIYGTPKIISIVSRGAFTPSPKVDSAILSISDISKKNFKNKIQEKKFFNLLKTGFAHKRKYVYQNIKKSFPDISLDTLKTLKLKETIRAEELSKEDWLKLLFCI